MDCPGTRTAQLQTDKKPTNDNYSQTDKLSCQIETFTDIFWTELDQLSAEMHSLSQSYYSAEVSVNSDVGGPKKSGG